MDMATVLSVELETARKIEAAIFRALAKHGQINAARMVGVSEGELSKWKSKEIPQLARLLAAIGLKAVPRDYQCFNPEKINAILTLARSEMQRIQHAEQLAEDDE